MEKDPLRLLGARIPRRYPAGSLYPFGPSVALRPLLGRMDMRAPTGHLAPNRGHPRALDTDYQDPSHDLAG